jgi:hypothetical protein
MVVPTQRQRRERLSLYLVVAVVVATTATDWPTGLLEGFWRNHSMIASVVSGLLLLAVGLAVVEGWVRDQEERQWRRTRTVAFKGLGHSTVAIRGLLDSLFQSHEPGLADWAVMQPYADPTVLTAVRDRVAALGSLPVAPSARRRALIADEEWAELAVLALEVLKQRHRETIRAWSPVMLGSDRLAGLLNSYSNLNEEIFRLQRPLRRSTRALSGARDWREHADELWSELVISSVVLHEHTMRAAGENGWINREARRLLDDVDLDKLNARSRGTPA